MILIALHSACNKFKFKFKFDEVVLEEGWKKDWGDPRPRGRDQNSTGGVVPLSSVGPRCKALVQLHTCTALAVQSKPMYTSQLKTPSKQPATYRSNRGGLT